MRPPLSDLVNEDGDEFPEEPYRGPPSRAFVLGFGPDLRREGTIEVIVARPFVGDRLIVPSVIGEFFVIVNLVIQGQSQLVAEGGIPAIAFSEHAYGSAIRLDRCPEGQTISLSYKGLPIGIRRRIWNFLREFLVHRRGFFAALRCLRSSYFPAFSAALIGEQVQ